MFVNERSFRHRWQGLARQSFFHQPGEEVREGRDTLATLERFLQFHHNPSLGDWLYRLDLRDAHQPRHTGGQAPFHGLAAWIKSRIALVPKLAPQSAHSFVYRDGRFLNFNTWFFRKFREFPEPSKLERSLTGVFSIVRVWRVHCICPVRDADSRSHKFSKSENLKEEKK
jgi:hypothetical protein